MKHFTFLITIVSLFFLGESGRLGKDQYDYSYTHLGLKISSNSEAENFGVFGSLALPGPLYANASIEASDINETSNGEIAFNQTISTARLGVHIGIGDLLNSISIGSASLRIENFMDVFLEGGVKKYSFEENLFESKDDKAFGNIVSGIKFGDANAWEGKIYIDFSKEVEDYSGLSNYQPCVPNEPCNDPVPPNVVFSSNADKKFGFDIQFNLAKRLSVVGGFKTSEFLETEYAMSFKFQY